MKLFPYLLLLAMSCVGRMQTSWAQPTTPAEMSAFLESIRQKHGVPALAAAIVSNDTIVATAVGLRKHGDTSAVTPTDKFHLGSCTKAMTATLLAMLVEDGKLRWNSTLSEIFPELTAMRAEYAAVTLRQLLSHRAGFRAETWPAGHDIDSWRQNTDSLTKQRLDYLKLVLNETPAAPPGTQMIYANRGYIVAGAIAERVTGRSWEELMQQRLFEPLGMKSAGFGWMAGWKSYGGLIDQPWSHFWQNNAWQPVVPGIGADNPLLLGPAGTVHCSLEDWAKFARFHLRSARGEEKLLSQKSFDILHTTLAADSDSALGWMVTQRDWGGGNVLTHSGSNNINFAVIWLAPQRNFAVLVATNSGAGDQICDEVAAHYVTLLGKQADKPH